ncbi:diacylglycerol/lipid kinase family protein [Mesobacillus foraminis]|uniref:YegS/Rv2252/BmrU family lipid kinase n=1 Tax=Mesobacillus foraminis TaxID=279826 RepID=A0A4R2BD95_9BACI|nr:diacylglycerol kinase family protein [Mesobacillus foraminis]TCN24385.1 YegS/Rv2252/BmrU family lipid kinase [Mesobacillus foraminis]
MKRIYFIVNLHAKNGGCRKTWGIIEKELKAKKVSYKAFFTEYPGHAAILADSIGRFLTSDEAFVTAVGGDGTFHEVVNGSAEHRNITLGFIPAGSGNDFSRGLGIPKHAKRAISQLLKSMDQKTVQFIDSGRISQQGRDHTYFINSMGAGFDADVAKGSNESEMKSLFNRFLLGRLIYVYILLKLLFTYKRTDMEIWVDGKKYKFEKVWFVAISNQIYYGGGMKIAPDAVPTDGLLDMTVVYSLSRLKLLFVFITVFWGGHAAFQEVWTCRGMKVSIRSGRKVRVHADGEVIGETPVMIQVCRGAVPVAGILTN